MAICAAGGIPRNPTHWERWPLLSACICSNRWVLTPQIDSQISELFYFTTYFTGAWRVLHRASRVCGIARALEAALLRPVPPSRRLSRADRRHRTRPPLSRPTRTVSLPPLLPTLSEPFHMILYPIRKQPAVICLFALLLYSMLYNFLSFITSLIIYKW